MSKNCHISNTSVDCNITNSTSCSIVGDSTGCVLVNCTRVTVTEGTNIVVINASDLILDSDYDGLTIVGALPSITISSDTTLSVLHANRTVYVDATSGDVTLTWDTSVMEDYNVYIVRKDGSANSIFIDATVITGTENFIGNSSFPIDLGLSQYDAVPLTSLDDTIYIRS